MVVDGNEVVVVPKEASPDILAKVRQLLATEHVLQEKVRAGAAIIGRQLTDVDEVFENVFAYQERATQGDKD
jgi:4-hydroxy-4-methyl-2-oxoglutarate aldolase